MSIPAAHIACHDSSVEPYVGYLEISTSHSRRNSSAAEKQTQGQRKIPCEACKVIAGLDVLSEYLLGSRIYVPPVGTSVGPRNCSCW